MLFPISDDDRRLSGPAVVTWVLLAANIALFLVQISDPDFTYGWSTVPQEITTGVDLANDVPVDAAAPGLEVHKNPSASAASGRSKWP